MIHPTLFLCIQFLVVLVDSSELTVPEIASYAKVSRNGAESTEIRNKIVDQSTNQGRSFENSRSPIYVSTKTSKIRNGEVIDHPSTKKYSTLDREAVAMLDAAITSRKQAQDRFHPPASFEHSLAHGNAIRQQQQQQKQQESGSSASQSSSNPGFPVPSYATLPKDVYSSSYNYQPDSKSPSNDDNSPPALSADNYPPDSSDDSFISKIPHSYDLQNTYQNDQIPDSPKFSGFLSTSSHDDDDYSPKPVAFPGHHYEHPSFVDDNYSHDHEYPHDLIYDHPPEDHYHDHTTTTEEPEMNDQRLSKRPYSYYYIGKKLWYLPLYFSIYFIIYIAALVLKSITRHKINFPSTLAAAAADARHNNDWQSSGWLDLTKRVLDGIDVYNGINKDSPKS